MPQDANPQDPSQNILQPPYPLYPPYPLIGLILAGGLSSRMGQHKPALKVYGDNQPDMLVRTATLLRDCVGDVWLSCRIGQTVAGYTCIQDMQDGLGPIGGIYAALHALQNTDYEGMLVLSCDLPFMQAENLRQLRDAHHMHSATRKATLSTHRTAQAPAQCSDAGTTPCLPNPPSPLMSTFQQADTGFIEALVSVYHRDAYSYFHTALTAGVRQINKVIPPHLRHDIVYQRPDSLPFFNINYPADLEMARRLIQAL